ncbi:LysR family transcriptional regulator [Craterilacuibacter sp.]|uniref:LysR family transcriptional regulator n=1 Tax=Craterilacuibacter sp. TaxID=2870909 RepID=UPI003F2DE62E
MELRDIRYLTVVAEHQNIGRAAEALGLSATALSKSLRRLEKSVGAKLVARAPQGVALTSVGAALLVRASPLQGILNDVRNEAADLAQGYAGQIRVGVSQGAAENLLADACVALSPETSRVNLKITVAAPSSFANNLRKGELDFWVADRRSFSPSEFTSDLLYDDAYVVFSSAHHPLAKQKKVSLANLVNQRWASTSNLTNPQWQQLILGMARQGLAPPAVTLETNSQAVRLSAIAFAGYLGISSREFVRKEGLTYPLVELPVKEVVHIRRMSIICRRNSYLSPAALRLIEILKTQTKALRDKRQRG